MMSLPAASIKFGELAQGGIPKTLLNHRRWVSQHVSSFVVPIGCRHLAKGLSVEFTWDEPKHRQQRRSARIMFAAAACLIPIFCRRGHPKRDCHSRRRSLGLGSPTRRLVRSGPDIAGVVSVGSTSSQDLGTLELLNLKTSKLKRALTLRGFDTTASFDRSALIELGVKGGVFPSSTLDSIRGAGTRVRRRRSLYSTPIAPVRVALRLVKSEGLYLSSGLFTDGERLALPLWHEADPSAGPLWFLLDTAIRRTAVSQALAQRLAIPAGGGIVRGLRFAGEPVSDLQVQVVPEGSKVLACSGGSSSSIAGLLGLDFLYAWDLDLDTPRSQCAAWRAGPNLAQGFGPRDALEVELRGQQGLLEVDARLCGTVCSGTDRVGPPLRAVVDLGQTYSACNWAAAKEIGVEAASPCVRMAGQWLDLDGKQADVYEADLGVELSGRVSGVARASRTLEQRLFWLSDSLPLLERMGFNPTEPCAMLGVDAVGRTRLAISARHRRLWLPA